MIADWQALAAAGHYAALADSLMEQHYDPRYGKHRARMAGQVVEVPAETLAPEALPDLAAQVAAAARGLTGT